MRENIQPLSLRPLSKESLLSGNGGKGKQGKIRKKSFKIDLKSFGTLEKKNTFAAAKNERVHRQGWGVEKKSLQAVNAAVVQEREQE